MNPADQSGLRIGKRQSTPTSHMDLTQNASKRLKAYQSQSQPPDLSKTETDDYGGINHEAVIVIKTDDALSLARAVVVAKAAADIRSFKNEKFVQMTQEQRVQRSRTWGNLRRKAQRLKEIGKAQKRKAIELLRDARISVEKSSYGPEDMEKIQTFFGNRYRLIELNTSEITANQETFDPSCWKSATHTEGELVFIINFNGTHFEAVSSVEELRSAPRIAFLNALHRLVSRGGCPKFIVSDNASQFKLAQKAMDKIFQSVTRSEDVLTYCATERIRWKHNVALAPWQGGFFERMVGAVKDPFTKAIRRKLLTADQFMTVLAQIEAIVNSRPLGYLARRVCSVPRRERITMWKADRERKTLRTKTLHRGIQKLKEDPEVLKTSNREGPHKGLAEEDLLCLCHGAH
ncbi:hypothetical protein QR680_011745 [Steinernema hermaphroditum]|uniref:Integrase catalytic domain-containing protein n=1 Tax=Steinernema hermaphroditum TaxID=289476 RepID=A0AA39I0T8_9BILA|nr:hypothetical protein QR680_011745 [Steinernema hermaphroditum]